MSKICVEGDNKEGKIIFRCERRGEERKEIEADREGYNDKEKGRREAKGKDGEMTGRGTEETSIFWPHGPRQSSWIVFKNEANDYISPTVKKKCDQRIFGDLSKRFFLTR